MNIKLVAIDLDGTTFNDKSEISNENITAIKKALAKGIFIVPCTGRGYFEIPQEILNIDGIKYSVLSNGGSVFDMTEKISIYSNDLDFEISKAILNLTKKYDSMVEIYYKGQPYSEKNINETFKHFTIHEKYFDVLINSRKQVDNIYDFFENNCDGSEKLNLFFANSNERQDFWDTVVNNFSDKIEITSSMPCNIEINKFGANKGDGLRQLCKILNIDMSDVLAMGDSDNDIPMLKAAGFSVAVGNAMESTKAAANEVTVKNTESAVAKVFEKYLHI